MTNFPTSLAILCFFAGFILVIMIFCMVAVIVLHVQYGRELYILKSRLVKLNIKTKHSCTQCGCEYLSPLRSNNVKKCTSCGHEMDWNLDPGQLPLVRSNRMVKRNDP